MDFENSDTFVFLWFGLWSIGAKPAFMNYNLSGATLAHCVKTSDASLLLVDPNVTAKVTDEVRKELSNVRIVELTPDIEREILTADPERRPDSDRSEDFGHNLAILIYTSGTTGMPKPAIVSWAKCISGGGFVARWLGWRPGDVFYTVRLNLIMGSSPRSRLKDTYLPTSLGNASVS
jgi:acyl-CoA synthetase (AMP-forming)/AMP-acid ligase II